MRIVQRTRKEAILPEMADRVAPPIPFQGVARMRLAQGQSHGFCMAGDGNKVNVIAHQAPPQDAQIVPLGMLAQDFQISPAVFVREEYDLPVITALRDVMRRVGNDNAVPSSSAWQGPCRHSAAAYGCAIRLARATVCSLPQLPKCQASPLLPASVCSPHPATGIHCAEGAGCA